MIEEVKKIIYNALVSQDRIYRMEIEGTIMTFDALAEVLAWQVCQLFPKSTDNPDGYSAESSNGRTVGFEPTNEGSIPSSAKPDEGRLLTEAEFTKALKPLAKNNVVPVAIGRIDKAVMKAQRDLTASILKAQEQARVERILKWGIEPCLEHQTGGGVFTRRECPKCWQSLKEKELK